MPAPTAGDHVISMSAVAQQHESVGGKRTLPPRSGTHHKHGTLEPQPQLTWSTIGATCIAGDPMLRKNSHDRLRCASRDCGPTSAAAMLTVSLVVLNKQRADAYGVHAVVSAGERMPACRQRGVASNLTDMGKRLQYRYTSQCLSQILAAGLEHCNCFFGCMRALAAGSMGKIPYRAFERERPNHRDREIGMRTQLVFMRPAITHEQHCLRHNYSFPSGWQHIAQMDRVRRDPAGIDLGDVFSLGPKPMKSLKQTSGTASPQRRPPGSAAASSSGLSDLSSQLEGLGGLPGSAPGSSTPAKRQTNASGQSTYQLDPFAELSLGDKPAAHRPMASRCGSTPVGQHAVRTVHAAC